MLARVAFALLIGIQLLPPAHKAFDLAAQVDRYRLLLQLIDPYKKLAADRDIHGVRNLRAVLYGVYYRGGVRNPPGMNTCPLQQEGLDNLCKQGFTEAIYLADPKYTAPVQLTTCQTGAATKGTLSYEHITSNAANVQKLLTRIHEHVTGQRPGPIYAHCWNGWHTSGVLAAIALRQFCDWSPAAAVRYWDANTDGQMKGYNPAPAYARIRAFTPYRALSITPAEQALICPAPIE
jgi:hypothetical protein